MRRIVPLLLSLLAALPLAPQPRRIAPLGADGKRVALVMGNDSYVSLDRLKNARNDARAVGDSLAAAGFQVSVVTDAKLEDMDRAVNAFIRSIQPRDVALFYYSGHAAEIDGQNLLIPVDLNRDLDEVQVRNRSLRASEVLERMESRGASLQLMVLDACRTNPFRSLRGGTSGGLASMAAGRGTFIAYASAPGKPASDNQRGGNGLFTSYLIEALRTPGLELQQVFAQAGQGTEDASGSTQVPWISHSVRGQFYFLMPAAAVTREPVAPVTATPVKTEALQTGVSKKVNPKDGLTYVWIGPGSFLMGCSPGDSECRDDEKPAKQVTIPTGFWMGQTDVTQEAYQRVIGSNPSHFKGPKLPVETVSWTEAQNYCQATGMRLPTEAEWEYAARAGTTGSRYGDIDRIAWYDKNSGSKTHDVATKEPNAWGLYDMLGNVYQWTADWFEKDKTRTLRGGSWNFSPWDVRASVRYWNGPADRYDYVGVRCVGN